MMMRAMTVVFGGTFDPVHFGHLRAAAELQDQLRADDFRLVPAGEPPHRERPAASGAQRLRMVELALAGHGDLRVDGREVARRGVSYMVDTLTELRGELGDTRALVMVVGQDAANGLDRWHRWRELFDLAHLAVMTRPGATAEYGGELARVIGPRRVASGADSGWQGPAGTVRHFQVRQLEIASTDIRCQVGAGISPRFLLPQSVIDYIEARGLYRD